MVRIYLIGPVISKDNIFANVNAVKLEPLMQYLLKRPIDPSLIPFNGRLRSQMPLRCFCLCFNNDQQIW